jgi:hypothetical protein
MAPKRSVTMCKRVSDADRIAYMLLFVTVYCLAVRTSGLPSNDAVCSSVTDARSSTVHVAML